MKNKILIRTDLDEFVLAENAELKRGDLAYLPNFMGGQILEIGTFDANNKGYLKITHSTKNSTNKKHNLSHLELKYLSMQIGFIDDIKIIEKEIFRGNSYDYEVEQLRCAFGCGMIEAWKRIRPSVRVMWECYFDENDLLQLIE